MRNRPWWWPKSHADIDKLLDKVQAFNTDYRLFMIRRAVVFATGCFFAFGMSWAIVMVLVIIGKDITVASKFTIGIICLAGGVCSLIAKTIDREVFDEMAEVFLGIPISRRTKKLLKDEYGIEL